MESEVGKRLDEQFIFLMLEVESRYESMNKHERMRVEQWVRQQH